MSASWQVRRMSPVEYGRAIARLGLNKAQAGRFLGVSTRTSHRYFDGDASIPVATVLLLRSMVHHGDGPIVPAWKRGDN